MKTDRIDQSDFFQENAFYQLTTDCKKLFSEVFLTPARRLPPPSMKIRIRCRYRQSELSDRHRRTVSRRSALPGNQKYTHEVQVFLATGTIFCRVLFSEELFMSARVLTPPMLKKKSRKRKYHAKPAKSQRKQRISQDRKR